MAVSVKLVVDKQKNKVAFAECGGDFVDILLSFLTLPLGTIVRLLDKKSGLGCLDMLYWSVENLETDYFQTDSCKSMLLQPRSAAEKLCEDLAIRIDDLDPIRLFRCPNWDCCSKNHRHYSSVAGVKCPCGQVMDKNNLWWIKKTEGTANGVFLESAAMFIVSNDLHVQVMPYVGLSVSLLQSLGITDLSMLEEISIQVNKSQVLHLLKRSLISKTPLTDVFLKHLTNLDTVGAKASDCTITIKREDDTLPAKRKLDDAEQCKVVKVKIRHSRSPDKTLLLVRSGNEFADLLFSFLALPLVRALSLLRKRYCSSTPGCIHHLYKSIDDWENGKEEILSSATKDMLLTPNVPPYFGCSDPKLKVDEMKSRGCKIQSCKSCFDESKLKCLHDMPQVKLTELNPKLTKTSSEYGGGFVRTSARFMITSDMMVKPIKTVGGPWSYIVGRFERE